MFFFNSERLKLGSFSRSPEWRSVRKAFLAENPFCAICNLKSSFLKPLEVHHCVPFHLDRSLELSKSNLITLCREHHYEWGHLFSWRSFNKNVREDIEKMQEKIKTRP